MATRLVEAGVNPLLWNRSANALSPFRSTAGIAPSAEAMIVQSDVVILMLGDDDAVTDVLGLDNEHQSARLAGRIVVNMGTGAPEASLAFEQAVAAAGGTYLEAPVSGSRGPAEAGQLLAMVAGGRPDQRAIVRQILEPLCKASVDAGPIPNGLRLKLAVNLYLVTSVAALAEAFHFGDRLGIDRTLLADLISAGPMASDVSSGKARKMAARDFSAQAAIRDVHKNCRLVADAAKKAGASTPMLSEALALFAARDREDGPAVDMASVIDVFGGGDAPGSAAQVVGRQLAAYQAKDLDAFMDCWSPVATIAGADGALLAAGEEAIRARHARRFTDPALDARLLRRTATGPMVIDEEIVTRTGRAGAIERVRVTGIYTVAADRIVAARFAEAPLSG